MKPEELQAIRDRHARTTQAEWVAEGLGSEGYIIRADVRGNLREVIETIGFNGRIAQTSYGKDHAELRANAEFMAHAHQDVPALLDEVSRLREALKFVSYDAPPRWGDVATKALNSESRCTCYISNGASISCPEHGLGAKRTARANTRG